MKITNSGIPLKSFYSPQDIDNDHYQLNITNPIQYPYTRGIYPDMYRQASWMKAPLCGFGLPEDTNKRLKFLIDQGAAAYHGQYIICVVCDTPTIMGYDCDHPLAHNEIGRCGVSISSLEDMRRLLVGLPMEKLRAFFPVYSTAPIILAMYIACGEERGLPPEGLSGIMANFPLGGFIADNLALFRPEVGLRLLVDTIEYCTKHMPHWIPMIFTAYNLRQAGGHAVQEVAFYMAMAIAIIEEAVRRGLSVDDFLPNFTWNMAIHEHFFEEIAKIRAARRIWARIARERFQAKNPKAWCLKTSIQTAGDTLTAQQPLNNIVRSAIQALAGVLAGVQGMHVSAYDEGLDIPTEQAILVSLRTQQIIEEETGVADVADPLGGSYYVESLTNNLEEEILKYMDKIESLGGYIAALNKGYLQQEVARASSERQKQIETGQRIKVGLNKYVIEEVSPIESFSHGLEVKEVAIERIRNFKRARNHDKVKKALDSVREAATGDSPLLPEFIQAVKAGATLGEIIQTLQATFGQPSLNN